MYSAKPFSRVLIVLTVLVLAAMACNLPFGGEASTPVVPTPVKATEEAYTEAPELFPTATQAATVEPTTAPTNAPTVAAATTQAPVPDDRVGYQGVSFLHMPNVFTTASAGITPMYPGEAGMTGFPGPVPAYYQFDLQGYPQTPTNIKPQILVFPIHEYAAVNSPAGIIAGKLDSELRTVEMAIDNQPFLPMWNAGQVFYARPEVMGFQNGNGIRYLTCFAQAFVRIDEKCLFYTYQGLTDDGNYYVSAIFPLDLPDFHTQDAENQFAKVMADTSLYPQYINEVKQRLNSAKPYEFFPVLDDLDKMVTSLNVAPTANLEAPAIPAFSCTGALATRLEPASRARVTFTDGTPLRVREAAGKNAKVIKTIPEGTEMFILEGPVCTDQGVWWHMQTTNGSLSGWVMEGDKGVYFIEPWK